MRRGEIWWADLRTGTHPVVLLSRNGSYERRRRATVALVISHARRIPVEVVLDQDHGLDHASVANVEIETIYLSDLLEQVGALDDTQLAQLDEALHFALGL